MASYMYLQTYSQTLVNVVMMLTIFMNAYHLTQSPCGSEY